MEGTRPSTTVTRYNTPLHLYNLWDVVVVVVVNVSFDDDDDDDDDHNDDDGFFSATLRASIICAYVTQGACQ